MQESFLCQFLRDEKMERVGAFVFSPEEGTPAATMDHVEEEVAKERAETLEMIQSQIMDEYNAAQIGKTMEVLVDGYDEEQEQLKAAAHTKAEEEPMLILPTLTGGSGLPLRSLCMRAILRM